MLSAQDDIQKKLVTKEMSKRKHANKLEDETIITTNTLNKLEDDEEYRSLSNTKDKNMKKKKKVSEDKTEVMKLSSNKMTNEKEKNTCIDIDTVHTKITSNSKIYKCEACEKLCKSYSSLKKHKTKVHLLNGDAVITTYISKHLGDEENTLILNTQVKKKKKKQGYKERNRVKKLNEAMIYKQQIMCKELPKVYLENDIDSGHIKVACNSKTYKCEVCEKSFKSDSALNEHKAKVHKFNKDEHITANISKCLENAKNKSLLNIVEKITKKRNNTSKEKIQVDNEVINHNKNIVCDVIDTKGINNNKIYKCEHCEKSCKSKSSLDKHMVKAHVLKKDADFATTNISKCSEDEVSTLLLNTLDKKIKKRKKASMEKIQVDNEVINHNQKRICDDINMKVMNNDRIYKCEHCEKSCKSNSSLDKHKAKAHILKKDADFTLTYNSKSSVDEVYTSLLNTQVKKMKKNKAKESVKTVTVKEKGISGKSKENSDSAENSTVHINKSQIGKFYKCNTCRKFEFLSVLKKRILNCYSTKVGPFKCRHCVNPFENAKNSLQCEICNTTYSTRSDLRNHYKVHTGEKPYACYVCSRSFSEKGYLTKHYRIHTGERPYVCDVCSKPFIQKANLTKHYRIHTGEKPYACDVCSRSFLEKGHLTSHYRIHTGERPYACDVCGKTFAVLFTLTSHYRIHTGERPYACDICGKTFAVLSSLTIHYRVHTGERPYNCGLCGMSFINCSNRNHHTRNKHDRFF